MRHERNANPLLPLSAILVAALCTAACSGNEGRAAAPAGKAAPSGSQTAAEPEPLLSPSEATIPTDEEADRQAAQQIDEQNADAEMEKLKKELEEGDSGG